jgi:hypothetical protein
MSDLLDKISPYNIFNYLLPGALFIAAANRYTSYTFTHENVVIAAFLIYFIGLVISRIGSLLVEPLLQRMKLLAFAPYEDYVAASKSDEKIDILSEVNNTYRTLVALCLCIFAFLAFDRADRTYAFVGASAPYVSGVALLLLLYLSWHKQSAYIVKRVRSANDSPKK